MHARSTLVLVLVAAGCATSLQPTTTTAPAPGATATTRAIRRDVPLTNTIRRAWAAGTRDSTGRPGRNYWQQWMEYTIAARLDVPTSTVSGREMVVLHNNSDSALHSIVLRLDQNYFAPRAARLDYLGDNIEVTDGMKISRLIVNGAQVAMSNEMPGGQTPRIATAYGVGESVMLIALTNAVPAKGAAALQIEWTFKVPGVSEGRGQRMGRYGDTLYQVAQWYPRVAMYDDLRGWDTEPYLGDAEFYNNFGKWDVSIDVPAGWLVGATGVLQNGADVLSAQTRERLSHVLESNDTRSIVGVADMGAGKATAAGDRLVWRFTADTAGDFAWATSKSYRWDATRANIPGRAPVPVYSLYLPGDSAQYQQAIRHGKHALEFYSNLWMPYAFPQLTMTDGPELGMEYPMFIMTGLDAADHETGHEWWPMMVGVNETWYGWMDEGFNQYMNILSDADRVGRVGQLDGQGQSYGRVSGAELESPMMWPANYQGQYYGFTTYGKAPEMLSALGGIVGDTAVWRAMSEYAKTWRFKHPSPWDWMFSMQSSLHRDLGWFWYYWLFTTESVNESIQSAGSLAGGPTTVTVRQDGEMPAPVVLRVHFASSGSAISAMPNAVMVDSTTALVTWPVDVWFNGSRTFTANLNFGGRAIESIMLDPYRRFPDKDPRDNVWPR